MGSLARHKFPTRLRSVSALQTRRWGESLGKLLSAGDVVGLVGSLGAGKTEFVRGVAAGLTVSEREVASPSFAIVYPYAGRVTLYHADFYRLANYEELFATGFLELLSSGEGAAIIEWLDRIPEAVPEELLLIRFSMGKEPSRRTLSVEPRGLRYYRLAEQWVSRIHAKRAAKTT